MKRLQTKRIIAREAVAAAFHALPRHRFLPESSGPRLVDAALDDAPVSLGEGQTISAPHMVAILLEGSEIASGDRVLEVGAGSGWLAALAGHLVGREGHVVGLEIVPRLAALAQRNVRAAGLEETVEVFQADGGRGWPERAPYDVILFSCAAPEVPTALEQQLAPGGRMLVPTGSGPRQTLVRVRRSAGGLHRESLGAVAFVPLTGEEGE